MSGSVDSGVISLVQHSLGGFGDRAETLKNVGVFDRLVDTRGSTLEVPKPLLASQHGGVGRRRGVRCLAGAAL